MPSHEQNRRRALDSAVRFLDAHRLDPTPDNYRLAYQYAVREEESVVRAVNRATDGGIRLHPDAAARILATFDGGQTGDAPPPHDDQSRLELRTHAMRLNDITQSTARATGDFNRDIATGIAEMDRDPSGASLRRAVETLAVRARQAEDDLGRAMSEIANLRQDLESARSDATLDALTGLPNRRAAEALLSEATRPTAIAFVDVDHFKSVNDRFGHSVGDRVLAMFGRVLAEECAPHTVARWGGEEFVVLFRGQPCAAAAAIVDKARQALSIRELRLRDGDKPLGSITFSAGVAPVGSDPKEAVRTADALLYRSKEEGRNRVTS